MGGETAVVGARLTGTALTELVRSAWDHALPSVAFDPGLRWRDVGLDSLKALELILRLEQSLGRKIAFDGMEPESTPADLLRLLADAPDAGARPTDRRPRVFFVPGLLGDDPTQARFRHALRREVAFEVLTMPGLETPSRVLGSIPARAARLVATVVERQPTGDIRLAGLSFGGLLAQEMARQLEARGRRVAFLAVLDGFLTPPVWQPPPLSGERRELVSAQVRSQLKHAVGLAIGPVLNRLNILGAVRLVLLSPPLRDRAWTRAQTRRLFRAWGQWSILGWRPGTCAASTFLVTTDDFTRFSSIDGWRQACPNLRMVHVPGGHYQFLKPVGIATFAPVFLDVLAQSMVAA